ncbi:hypothetical protein [Caballeronia sordidicola]|uniref:hypothetical protein n=1 Tax=Caballeronia sordidicola TaxID=196367 RepID=UPI00117E2F54|nr:hypothetical protein [Caballeronia sordidicola]
MDDLQACQSCPDVAAATKSQDPNGGEYYRGALWNPLFAAYIHNCQPLARQLLSAGANPSIGGQQASMVLSVANRWPHDKIEINQQWAKLLASNSASVDAMLPYTDSTARNLVATGESTVDYPYIWQGFLTRPAGDMRIARFCRSLANEAGGSYQVEEDCRKRESAARARIETVTK